MEPAIVKKLNVTDVALQSEHTLFTSKDCTLMVDGACKGLADSHEIVLLPRQEYDRLCLADANQGPDKTCSSNCNQHKNDVRKDLHEGEPVMVSDNDLVFSLRYYFKDGMASDKGLDACYTSVWRHIIPYSMFNPNNDAEYLYTQFDYGTEGNRKYFAKRDDRKSHKRRSGVYFKDEYANNLKED